MRNKRGFTLIEVLSVIIIIGVILLIAFPAVSNYIDKANRGSYVADVNAYMETIKSEYEMNEYGDFIKEDEIMIVPIEHIKLEKGDGKSPYAPYDFSRSYVLIVQERNSYVFYATVVDEAGIGVIQKAANELDRDSVEEELNEEGIVEWEAYKSGVSTFIYKGVEYEMCEVRDIEKVEKVISNAIVVMCEK